MTGRSPRRGSLLSGVRSRSVPAGLPAAPFTSLTRMRFEEPSDPIDHPLWRDYLKNNIHMSMNMDHLADRADRHLNRLVDFECSGVEELETLNHDIGAVRTVRDLAKNGGLTAAGRVMAERVVATAEEWFESKTGEKVAGR